MAAVGVTNYGVLQTANPFFAFLKIPSLKVERLAIDGNRKGRVVLVVDADYGTFQTNAAPSYSTYHFFARLKKKRSNSYD